MRSDPAPHPRLTQDVRAELAAGGSVTRMTPLHQQPGTITPNGLIYERH